jgi:hypothetical protein
MLETELGRNFAGAGRLTAIQAKRSRINFD